jgi:hypothetical protein
MLPKAVLIQFVSPDDEHYVLETCRELYIKNKYVESNLCVTLVIYQESLHDERSKECKKHAGSFREHGNGEATGGWTNLHMRRVIISTLVRNCQVVGHQCFG